MLAALSGCESESKPAMPRRDFHANASIKGSLEQNKDLLQAMDRQSVVTRKCYYRGIGASDALIKWLRDSDCESVYCREMESQDVTAVPEFQRALALSEKELPSDVRESGQLPICRKICAMAFTKGDRLSCRL